MKADFPTLVILTSGMRGEKNTSRIEEFIRQRSTSTTLCVKKMIPAAPPGVVAAAFAPPVAGAAPDVAARTYHVAAVGGRLASE